MDNEEIKDYLTTLTTQMILLRGRVDALQSIFFAYLAVEHNDQNPKFSEFVRAEYFDIFGEKISESFEKLPPHGLMSENIREGIFRQMEILKNDLDTFYQVNRE